MAILSDRNCACPCPVFQQLLDLPFCPFGEQVSITHVIARPLLCEKMASNSGSANHGRNEYPPSRLSECLMWPRSFEQAACPPLWPRSSERCMSALVAPCFIVPLTFTILSLNLHRRQRRHNNINVDNDKQQQRLATIDKRQLKNIEP